MVRFKNRYVVFTIKPHNDQDDEQVTWKNTHVSNAIKRKVQQLYGDVGAAAIRDGFDAKYCNAQTKIAIVRLRHGPHKYALKAIPQINNVGGRLVKTKILYVGATLKHCFLFIRKHQERKLEQFWSKLPTEAARKRMETLLMTLTPAMKDLKGYLAIEPQGPLPPLASCRCSLLVISLLARPSPRRIPPLSCVHRALCTRSRQFGSSRSVRLRRRGRLQGCFAIRRKPSDSRL